MALMRLTPGPVAVATVADIEVHAQRMPDGTHEIHAINHTNGALASYLDVTQDQIAAFVARAASDVAGGTDA